VENCCTCHAFLVCYINGCNCRDKIGLAVLELLEEGELQKLHKKWWIDKGQCVAEDTRVLMGLLRVLSTYVTIAPARPTTDKLKYVIIVQFSKKNSSASERNRRTIEDVEMLHTLTRTVYRPMHMTFGL